MNLKSLPYIIQNHLGSIWYNLGFTSPRFKNRPKWSKFLNQGYYSGIRAWSLHLCIGWSIEEKTLQPCLGQMKRMNHFMPMWKKNVNSMRKRCHHTILHLISHLGMMDTKVRKSMKQIHLCLVQKIAECTMGRSQKNLLSISQTIMH